MQRIKVYEDAENIGARGCRLRPREKSRQALGEIKNTIVTRSKYSELNNGWKDTQYKEITKPKQKRSVVPKKTTNKKVETKYNESPQIKQKRRLSNMYMVTEYVNDIYKYLQRIEDKYPIKECMKIEKKFGEYTRFALIDWLVEINEHFKFIEETLQLCVSVIDRYVQEDPSLTRNDLQLIALASVFIASKYEEILPMEVNDLLFVCESALPPADILRMEAKIVARMQFSFGRPVPVHFIRRYCHVVKATSTEQACAFYLSDVALMSYKLCHQKPSVIAASAFYVALCVSNGRVDKSLWNLTLIRYSTYELSSLEDCVTTLARCLKTLSSSRFRAIQRKYSTAKYSNVSELPVMAEVIDQLAQ